MPNVKCAHVKKDGKRCEAWAVSGYTRCQAHGGPVPARGFYGTGTMTTGASSSFPLTRLAAKYNQMTTEGRILSNRAAIEVIDLRVKQLLERVDVDEAPERVAKLYDLWTKMREHQSNGRETEAMALAIEIDTQFEKVYHDYQAWTQIFQALDLRGRSVEREVKILKEIRAVMTAEDAYQMIAKLLGSVMRVIGDEPAKLKQVQYEFARIIGESSDRVAEEVISDDWGGGGEGLVAQGLGDMDTTELLYPGDQE
jgi:hypothetical protein